MVQTCSCVVEATGFATVSKFPVHHKIPKLRISNFKIQALALKNRSYRYIHYAKPDTY